MTYSFHPDAEREFVETIEYYEKKELGLGYDFAVEVYSTIERTVAFPKVWPVLEEDIRRSLVRRFPYGHCIFGRGRGNLYPGGYASA